MNTKTWTWKAGLACVIASMGALACSASTEQSDESAAAIEEGEKVGVEVDLDSDDVDDEMPEGVAAITGWGAADGVLVAYRTVDGQQVPYASVARDETGALTAAFYNANIADANIGAATAYVLRLAEELTGDSAADAVDGGADAAPAPSAAPLTERQKRRARRRARWRALRCHVGNVAKALFVDVPMSVIVGPATFITGATLIVGGGAAMLATGVVPCWVPGVVVQWLRGEKIDEFDSSGNSKWKWTYQSPIDREDHTLRGAMVPLCAPRVAFAHVVAAGAAIVYVTPARNVRKRLYKECPSFP